MAFFDKKNLKGWTVEPVKPAVVQMRYDFQLSLS